MPNPLWVVVTGNGLHAYWPMSVSVGADVWQAMANMLKALCKAHEFHADAVVTADRARLMRTPYGLSKAGNVVRARRVAGDPYAPEVLLDALIAGCAAKQAVPAPVVPKVAAERVAYSATKLLDDPTTPCGHATNWLTDRWPEPYWRGALAFIALSSDTQDEKLAAYARVSHIDNTDEREWNAIEQRVINIVNSGANPYTKETLSGLIDADPCAVCKMRDTCHSPVTAALLMPIDELPQLPVVAVLTSMQRTIEIIDVQGEVIDTPAVASPTAQEAVSIGDITFVNSNPDAVMGTMPVPALWAIDRSNKVAKVMEVAAFVPECVGWSKGEQGAAITFMCAAVRGGLYEQGVVIIDAKKIARAADAAEVFTGEGYIVKDQSMFLRYVQDRTAKFQQRIKEVRVLNHLGWQSKIATQDPDKFAFADCVVFSDGEATPSTLNQALLGGAVTFAQAQAGTIEGWRDGIARLLPNDPDTLAQQMMVCAGFGAPLHELGGETGGAVMLQSTHSGTGKTSACHAGLSIWGDPRTATSASTASLVAVQHTMGACYSLPAFVDEVTTLPFQEFRAMLYSSTAGSGKRRLRQDGTSNPHVDAWTSYMFVTGNRPLREYTIGDTSTSQGIGARVFEVAVPRRRHGESSDEMSGFLSSQHGVVGRDYIKHIMQSMSEVREMYAANHRDLCAKFKGHEYESLMRFWLATAASIITGGDIAVGLGYVHFDMLAIKQFVIDAINNMVSSNIMVEPSSDYAMALGLIHASRCAILDLDDLDSVVNAQRAAMEEDAPFHAFRSVQQRVLWVPYSVSSDRRNLREWHTKGFKCVVGGPGPVHPKVDPAMQYFRVPFSEEKP
jgi:hypothetical protein